LLAELLRTFEDPPIRDSPGLIALVEEFRLCWVLVLEGVFDRTLISSKAPGRSGDKIGSDAEEELNDNGGGLISSPMGPCAGSSCRMRKLGSWLVNSDKFTLDQSFSEGKASRFASDTVFSLWSASASIAFGSIDWGFSWSEFWHHFVNSDTHTVRPVVSSSSPTKMLSYCEARLEHNQSYDTIGKTALILIQYTIIQGLKIGPLVITKVLVAASVR